MGVGATDRAASTVDTTQLVNAHRAGVIAYNGQAQLLTSASGSKTSTHAATPQFADVLRSKAEGLRFSAHAVTRMKSRQISLTPEVIDKLERAASGAANKGSRSSLVLIRDLAFIVNIPNRTVVTAMDGESIRDNVFTNIDSAVVAN